MKVTELMLALINLLENFERERVDFITYETTCMMLKIGPLAAKGRMKLRQFIIFRCFDYALGSTKECNNPGNIGAVNDNNGFNEEIQPLESLFYDDLEIPRHQRYFPVSLLEFSICNTF